MRVCAWCLTAGFDSSDQRDMLPDAVQPTLFQDYGDLGSNHLLLVSSGDILIEKELKSSHLPCPPSVRHRTSLPTLAHRIHAPVGTPAHASATVTPLRSCTRSCACSRTAQNSADDTHTLSNIRKRFASSVVGRSVQFVHCTPLPSTCSHG